MVGVLHSHCHGFFNGLAAAAPHRKKATGVSAAGFLLFHLKTDGVHCENSSTVHTACCIVFSNTREQ